MHATVFALYTALRGYIVSWGNQEVSHLLLVFQATWQWIQRIEGKDLPNAMAKVTFVGKNVYKSDELNSNA